MPRMKVARREAVRQRILEAGMTVFERDGFTRSSMTAIAAEAGLSAGGLYTHFESKEELFLAAFAALVSEEDRAIEQTILGSRDTASTIDVAVDYVAQIAAGDDPGFRGAGARFLLHAWATADTNGSLREALLRRRAKATELTRAIIDGARARGELPDDIDVEALAVAVTSFLDGLFLQRAERGADFRVDDARRQAHTLVDAIFHTRRRPGSARPASDRS